MFSDGFSDGEVTDIITANDIVGRGGLGAEILASSLGDVTFGLNSGPTLVNGATLSIL